MCLGDVAGRGTGLRELFVPRQRRMHGIAKRGFGIGPGVRAGAFDDESSVHEVVHLVAVVRRDRDSAVRLAGHQAFAGELRQRLAYGAARDAELLGDRHLAQRGSRYEVAREQRVPQCLGNAFDRRAVLELECVVHGPDSARSPITPFVRRPGPSTAMI